ncbi:MAG TPA: Mu transposase C-terminal domain-containing protein [Allosphingosinicella sp.]|jgi:putative transposase
MYDGVELQEDPEAPLDLIEIDHTVADLFVVSDGMRIPIGRPTIAMAVDRCTRMPFGLYIGFEPPSVLTVMQCLKNGILPKTYIRRTVEAGEWTIQNDWPVFGMPRGLLFDRALENVGHDIRRNAAGLGITRVRFAKRKTPRHKGAIERFFLTLNKRLLHEQRGTTFSNVMERKDYDAEKNAIITLDELYEQAHRFLVDIYPRRRHGGIRDVPYRRWNQLTQRYRIDPLADLQELIPYFGRTFHASLQREGVRFKHIVYNSEELAVLRRSPAFVEAAGEKPHLTVQYDPADLGSVRVYLPHRKRYLLVQAVPKWRDYADGLSLWEHRTILRFERERSKAAIEPDTLAEAMVALVTKMDTAIGGRRSGKNRKKVARLTGQGRISPAGDDTATTPKNSTHGRQTRLTKASNENRPLAEAAATPVPEHRPRRIKIISAAEPYEP